LQSYTVIGAHQGVEALGGLHLLDVDTGIEASAVGREHHHPDIEVLAT